MNSENTYAEKNNSLKLIMRKKECQIMLCDNVKKLNVFNVVKLVYNSFLQYMVTKMIEYS